jgi:glycosyltransferase involved in cell wall biosynthesis
MRIAFVVIGNSRRSNYLNGYTIRYGGGGGSGTDTSTILVAEYLASQGHEVAFVTDGLEPALDSSYKERGENYPSGTLIRGVQYCNNQFEGVDNREFDILVSMLWFTGYEELPITVTKAVLYYSHMQWIYGYEEMLAFAQKRNIPLGFIHISEWERGMTNRRIEHAKGRYDKIFSTLIPNPIFDEMINEVIESKPERKPHKFIFHAAWARGGNVAVEAVRQLPYEDKEFHAFDYLMATHAHPDEFFNMHNGVDKKTLFTHIAESEYFIYPLYTPYKDVHKDTFSCVVAEAIALGAIPITYALGALPEYFRDYCAFLTPPATADLDTMNKEPLSRDEEGIFTCVDNIVATIKFLESNPSHKEHLRENGQNYILDRFNLNKVGGMWTDFINDITNDR